MDLNEDDNIDIEGVGAGKNSPVLQNIGREGPSLSTVLANLDEDERVLESDPRALQRLSTAPCMQTDVGLSEKGLAEMRQRSSIQAALESPQALTEMSAESRKQYMEISESFKNLPTSETVTYLDNRRLHMPAEVRDVPNRISKRDALRVIEKLVGESLTARIIKCAMGGGFVAKPHVWFSQRLWAETVNSDKFDKLEPISGYSEELEGDKGAIIPQAISRLFSASNTQNLMVICRIHRITMLHLCKIAFVRICEIAEAEKRPEEYVEKYDSMPELEKLLAS